jgi:hypothetical protein
MPSRPRSTMRHGIRDTYETYGYKELHSFQEYSLIVKAFFALLSKSMIEGGMTYKLPKFLGCIGVKKSKGGKRKILDYGHYKTTGEKVFRRLYHGDGHIAYFNWYKQPRYCRIKFKNTVKFRPVRANKKALTDSIRQKDTMKKYLAN